MYILVLVLILSAQVRKEELSRDFNCAYWQKRFTLRVEQTPAFLEDHAQALHLRLASVQHETSFWGSCACPRATAASLSLSRLRPAAASRIDASTFASRASSYLQLTTHKSIHKKRMQASTSTCQFLRYGGWRIS